MALGFTGSYGRVPAFAHEWRVEQRTAARGIFVPLSFRPGEAFQFEWSEDYAVMAANALSFRSHTSSCISATLAPLDSYGAIGISDFSEGRADASCLVSPMLFD